MDFDRILGAVKIKYRNLVLGWPYLLDSLLMLTLFTLHLIGMSVVAKHRHDVPWPPDWSIAFSALAIGPIALRQRFPLGAYFVALASGSVVAFMHRPVVIISYAGLIGLYTVHLRASTRWAAVATVAAVCWIYLPQLVTGGRLEWYWAVGSPIYIALGSALGQLRKRGFERRAELELTVRQLEAAKEQLAKEAVLIERTRIARELHDIVAHGISLIAVRAGVARALLPGNPAQAQESVAVIEKVARESLAEMRHMLGALRSLDDDRTDEIAPQPSLRRLDELVERARSSGLAVEVVRYGDQRELPPGQELAAYRIVQEALTNVVKHAGPVRSTATLRYLPDRLVIDVFNESGRKSFVDRGGQGLVGMRERAALYGGTLRAGIVEGGYRVTAELPMETVNA